jgi:hypothetical protein
MRFFSRRISRAERAASWSSSLLLQLEWRAMAWEEVWRGERETVEEGEGRWCAEGIVGLNAMCCGGRSVAVQEWDDATGERCVLS